MRDAGVALLDRIGKPVILLGHSQGGPIPWLLADARPVLVKAILAIEPASPPFNKAVYGKFIVNLIWGITEIPITYDPPVSAPSEVEFGTVNQYENDMGSYERASTEEQRPKLFKPLILQKEPARKLLNLQNIPVLLVTAEASYHAAYDYQTVAFLRQAGIKVEHLDLPKVGIFGNGHMMFMELNNLDIAARLVEWVEEVIEKGNRGVKIDNM